MSESIRVLVVDDSPFIRYTIAKHLEADPEISVVGSAQDGLDALGKIPALNPDVITLDVEMPQMDGLTTLQQIMIEHPTPVVMLSSLTQRGTRTTIQALMRGAVDFVAKPAASTDIRTVVSELRAKIKAAARSRMGRVIRQPGPNGHLAEPAKAVTKSKGGLRPFHNGDPVVVIGASTGGPRALHQVLTQLPGDLPAAVAVVQPMPAGFTRSLAQRLNEAAALTVQEATDGDRLAQSLVLLAPGDYHLRFTNDRQVGLDQGPRRHHVRPAVDLALESAAQHHGSKVIGVVLTGMGVDGAAGAAAIKSAGGRVIAEHESSTVVYGMPRSVIEAGHADRIVPLTEVAAAIMELINHGR